MPPLEDIVEDVEDILTVKDLQGQCVLVTAGPTREAFDPVRFITNYSTGKMGYAVAVMAKRRGAKVTLVSGPTSLPQPRGVAFVSVSSARQMRDAVMANLEKATVVVKSAAVADYRPAGFSESKIKKSGGPLEMRLERNPDIISEVGRVKGKRILVGFAVETENLIQYATKKMMEKNMDLIVANDITRARRGICGGDEYRQDPRPRRGIGGSAPDGQDGRCRADPGPGTGTHGETKRGIPWEKKMISAASCSISWGP